MPGPVVLRIGILRFENLTGNPSLDWIANAAPSILAEQLVGADDVVPIRAGNVSEAYLAGANRFLHGTVTELHGALHFDIQDEDAARHKTITDERLSGNVLDVLNRAAHQLDPAAQPFSTSNPEALKAWAQGDSERAVKLDPDFGAAWMARAEDAARKGDNAEALGIVDQALARPGLRSEIDHARLALLSATLKKDDPARENALTELHRLDPADTSLTQRLAEFETQARNFEKAAGFYREILQQDRDSPPALLALGYDQAYAGQLDAARKTFEQYGQQEGQKTNSLDSLGEAYFMNGHFAEAEKFFAQANASSPAFLEGSDLEKAAYAHWLSGDLKGADTIMARYIAFRGKAHDPLVPWREACWDYATGRRELALKNLAQAPKPIADRQMAAWNATPDHDVDSLKAAYLRSNPSTDGLVRTLYAQALLDAGQRDEARKLAERWPLPAVSGPEGILDSTVFPRFLGLRKQLGLTNPSGL